MRADYKRSMCKTCCLVEFENVSQKKNRVD